MILLAVALFAALAYTVTNSTRSTGGDTSRETTTLTISQLLQHGASLQTAYMRLKISNGCTDAQISFDNPINSPKYINPSAPATNVCHIFQPAGGNVSPLLPKIIDPLETIAPDNQWQYFITNSTGGFGSPADDLFAYAKIPSQNLCNEINLKANGVTSIPTLNIAVLASGIPGQTTTGVNFSTLQGKFAGCFYTSHTWSLGYWFYQVLEIR